MEDVIIIGAGAAGLTSAIYTCRKALKTLVITKEVGGETNLTNDIQNYPGYFSGPGPELMKIFRKQAEHFGAKIIEDKVLKVEKNQDTFKVKTEKEEHTTKTVILALGRVRRKLNILGEEKYMGRGVSTCVTCDGPLFHNKTVAVIGGGNAGVEGVLELSKIAKKVYLVHRRQEFKADAITVDKIKQLSNVEFVLDSSPTEIKGAKLVEGLVVENINSKVKRELQVNGVFIEIGYDVDTSMVDGLVETNANKEIVIDMNCKTKTPGLFSAGDLTLVPYKQTVISAGLGAVAGLEAHRFISKRQK